MRALFDINHPAQVHFFRHVIRRLKDEKHDVVVAARDKDVTFHLLDVFGIEHEDLSRCGSGLGGLVRELIVREVRLVKLARRFRPDVLVGRGGVTIGPVGALMRIPRVVFDDTEHATIERAISLPLATCICTGTGYLAEHGRRQVRFRGVPVLAYLHPRVFSPDPAPLREAGLDPHRPLIVLRIVSWLAAHDIGVGRSSQKEIRQVIDRLSAFGQVLISSEAVLPSWLAGYRNPVPPEHMHDLLAFASLYIGQGGSMASEAAVLGTPSIFCSPLRHGCGCILALEREHQLVRTVDSLREGVTVAEAWLRRPGLRETWRRRRRRMLEESEDIVEFMRRVITRTARDRVRGGGVP